MKAYRPGQNKNKQKHGLRAEKQTAKRLGARLMPGSGSLDGAKGDMETARFLVENKATVKDQYALKHETLCKIAQEATEKSLYPAIALQFTAPRGRPKRDGAWVLIPENVFRRIAETVE